MNRTRERIRNKKAAGFIAAAAIILVMTGCADKPRESAPAHVTAAQSTAAQASGELTAADAAHTGASEAEAAQADPVLEEEREETVTVVIPTVYESVATQEEADKIREANGYESATLEEDGSLTIVMSRGRYDEMVRQFREAVDKGISEILASDTDSIIEKIEYNDDYSVFTVTVASDEIGIMERQTAGELIMYGTLYHVYTGNDADHIQVDYVSRETGEVIESADSGSLTDAY